MPATSATPAELRKAYESYADALERKGSASSGKASAQLVGLDTWYRGELRDAIQARKAKAHIDSEELRKIVKWKLSRGKWRPSLEKLAASNADEDVRRISQEAFALCAKDLANALKKISELKGVGPATGSAVLAAYDPEHVPFMSDEFVLVVLRDDKPQYTPKFYAQFRDEAKTFLEKNSELFTRMDELEMAAWSLATMPAGSSAPSARAPASSAPAAPSKAAASTATPPGPSTGQNEGNGAAAASDPPRKDSPPPKKRGRTESRSTTAGETKEQVAEEGKKKRKQASTEPTQPRRVSARNAGKGRR